MEKIKVIQIGVEHDHAAETMASMRRLSDIYEVVAFCDPEEEIYISPEGERTVAGRKLKDGATFDGPENYAGIPQMSVDEALSIPGVEAAVIESSETNLTHYARLAADKGLHVHMDKPGGTDLSEYTGLIDAFRKSCKVFQAGYMYRYNPEIMKLMQEIDEGIYGKILYIEAQMNCHHKPIKRDWLKKYQGGMMFFLGCHLIDLIYRIQGEPEEVIPMNTVSGIDGAMGEDEGFAVLKYRSGVSFAKTTAVEAGGYMRRQLVVVGEKGTAVLEPLEAYLPGARDGSYLYTGVRKVTSDIHNWKNDGERYNSEPYNRYDGMMSDFAAYIRGEKENPYSLDYELGMYKVLLRSCRM